MSDRTKLLLRLWSGANYLVLALGFGALIVASLGYGLLSVAPVVVPLILITLAAMIAFRSSFYRSWERDQCALVEGTEPVEKPDA